LERVVKHGDEVARKETDDAGIATETAGPPRAVAGVETFDQVAFHEPEIAGSL
jgi:hypothetical protein